MKRIISVVGKNFRGAFETNGSVIRSSHVLKFMLGWSDDKVRGTCKKNKWTASIVGPDREREFERLLTEIAPLDAETQQSIQDAFKQRFDKEGGGIFEHYCHCGRWASYGFGVSILRNEPGEWFCREHIPAHLRQAA